LGVREDKILQKHCMPQELKAAAWEKVTYMCVN